MNINRLKIIIDEWYKYLDKDGVTELEKDIEIPFKDFIIQLLQNIYNYYKDVITYIPVNQDNNSEYIIKPKNGVYSLEDFLINRLLRNISLINYRKQSLLPDSHYDRSFGEISIDKNRVKNSLTDVGQRRKLVAHELLHGLKTQFVDHNIFRIKDYYALKETLKIKLPQEVNDFAYNQGNGQNGMYSHIGLTRKKHSLNMSNLDETFNEVDAIRFSNDSYCDIAEVGNKVYVVLNNPESSNTFITNYAYIIEKLLDKKTLFTGMYINPDIMIDSINRQYTNIFNKNYNNSKTSIETIIAEISLIKKVPDCIDRQLKFLETFHECMDQHAKINGLNEQDYDNNILFLGNHGLLEIKDNKLTPHSSLSYSNEYDVLRNKKK